MQPPPRPHDPGASSLAPDLLKRHASYGLRGGEYRGEILETTPQGTRFVVRVRGELRGPAHIRMPGVHYAQNALAVAEFFGVPFSAYQESMAGLAGVHRRFSLRGEAGGVLVVDDYGHHPTEIAATVAAARLYGRRLVVAFQPHRYSRTRDLLADFAPALADADLVVLTDIYAAGEAPLDGITSAGLAATFPRDRAPIHATRRELCDVILDLLRPGDLLLTLGAGDITQVATEILTRRGG